MSDSPPSRPLGLPLGKRGKGIGIANLLSGPVTAPVPLRRVAIPGSEGFGGFSGNRKSGTVPICVHQSGDINRCLSPFFFFFFGACPPFFFLFSFSPFFVPLLLPFSFFFFCRMIRAR